MDIARHIARELNVAPAQVQAAVALLDDGATVPFIARYRKEATGALDDTQLRHLEERLHYLRELAERRETVLKSIEAQGRLTDTLRAEIMAADNKTALEDLYLPYKPKRRSKAQIARENGLDALAQSLLDNPDQNPETAAQGFLNENVADTKAALDGARAVLMEIFSEDAALTGRLREKLWQEAEIFTQLIEDNPEKNEKFKDYFDYRERIAAMPGHRVLAVLRARNEGIVQAALDYPGSGTPAASIYEEMIAGHFRVAGEDRAAGKWLRDTVRLAWRAKIFLSLENDAFARLKDEADTEAIGVFAKNLKDLLLAAPAGQLPVLGLDPGLRTGVKIAAVDGTGKLTDTAVIYLHKAGDARKILENLIKKHQIKLIAIGNGTASRETGRLAAEVLSALPENIRPTQISVSEAGASVYSASELAAREFPELDVSLRGAVSIARRLQDPLAELVKIEPKSIGVGQYQHDVQQTRLAKSLDAVVEDCVNAVGVDVNTASAPLLARISGLNAALAANIVAYRDENGAFPDRKTLLKVPRLGAKTFEQAAGFLRIRGGSEPLDASAVHPEAYPLVAQMLAANRLDAAETIGNSEKIRQIRAKDFVGEQFGLPTILDILRELEKPGRDPRSAFQTANFAENINEIKDLEVGMILEGVVTNVANFGAFIDIGVHQDGLVHISAMAERFVRDPRDIVKTGDIVKVRVAEVDAARKRISLTMRLNGDFQAAGKNSSRHSAKNTAPREKTPHNCAMAEAFSRLKK